MGSQKRALRASPPGRSGRAPAAAASRESGDVLHASSPLQKATLHEPQRKQRAHHEGSDNDNDRNSQDPSSAVDFSNDSMLIIDEEAGQMEPIDAMLSGWFSMPGAAISPLYSGDQTTEPPEFA
ncbi:uncharacterized protein P174DRAFT_415316, partial [Aspergillus novofumigatus IBT 16806]